MTSTELAPREHPDIEQTPSVELEPQPPAMPGLFGSSNPDIAMAKAAGVSKVLADAIRSQKLAVPISGREHVLVEGWTLLGSLLGVFPVTVWTHKLEDGWEARVEAKTLTGAVVGAAESECLRTERKWAKADDYAIRSMAQTRAVSKALKMPLGFVMRLAGYETTPADEMPDGEPTEPAATWPLPDPVKPTSEQKIRLNELLAELTVLRPETDWPKEAGRIAGVPGDTITRGGMDGLLRHLEAAVTELHEGAPA
jgi:hypothetical protein